jgi:streptogramin lyase
VWIANSGGSGSVTELGHNGAPAGTFTAGSISTPTAIAVDTSGDIWVANGNSTLTELSSLGTNMNSGPFSGGGLSGPTSISFDGLGNVWLANYSNSSVSEFSSTGSAISGTNGYTASGLTSPIGVAINPH